MSKVTGKLQITLPKALAERYEIRPGDDIHFEEAGEAIRLVTAGSGTPAGRLDTDARLRLFDAASARQRAREARGLSRRHSARGWNREGLYERGRQGAD